MIIFDLDGTLIDSSEGIIMAIKYVIDKYHLSIINGRDEHQFIGPRLEEQFAKACGIDSPLIETVCAEFADYYENRCLECYTVYPGVKETIAGIYSMGIDLALATYKPISQTIRILRGESLEHYFIHIACAEVGVPKTKEDLIWECLCYCKTGDSRRIYVGDTEKDEYVATRCDLDFVAAGYGFNERKFSLDTTIVINKFPEIIRILEEYDEYRV